MLRRLVIALSLSVAACGGSSSVAPTVNASGSYTGTVSNLSNTCPEVTASDPNPVPLMATVTQTDTANITLNVEGGLGLFLAAALGTRSITGTVSGSHIEAVLIGTTTLTEFGCSHGWQGNLSADVNGNTMSGSIVYTPQNMSGSCAMFMQCVRQQTFTMTK